MSMPMNMGGFTYHNGQLCAEKVALERIAAEIGTPFYGYSKARIEQNYRDFTTPFKDLKAQFFYAIKANANIAVIKILAACGAGADVTSAGEMERALKAGIKPDKIIYSGVGKTRAEITEALQLKIHQINIESIPELRQVSAIATELGVKAAIALRVNPDVAAHTHHKLATSETGVKFGIEAAQLEEAMMLTKSLPALELKGFQVHVGTHLHNYEDFREAYGRLADMVRFWRDKGYVLDRLDLGGGVGIPYDGETPAPFGNYVEIVRDAVGNLGCALAFEPGRRLVGDAGVLVARVVYDKRGISKRFLILDAGMNDLIRPAMYEARHSIVPLKESAERNAMLADVVGPVCETGDLFGVDYRLPGVGQGDAVAFLQAGAYGAAMSSNYNGRPLVAEVLVDGDGYSVIRRRVSITEQIGWENGTG